MYRKLYRNVEVSIDYRGVGDVGDVGVVGVADNSYVLITYPPLSLGL